MAATSSSGLPMSTYVVQQQEAKTHVEERLRGARTVPVVAGKGRGGDCWRDGQELHQALAKTNNKKYNRKYDKYDEAVLSNLTAKGDWGMCNLPRAHTPRATIGSRRRNNNTRTPRVRGSGSRRFCQALPAGVAKGRAMGTDWSLRHKAFVCSGPEAGAVMRTSRQRTIGLGPDRTPATTSLLHACWQGVIATAPLGAGISPVGGVIQRQTPCSLRAPNGFFPHPVSLPLPGGDGDHHKLPHQFRPRALLVALGSETDRLARRRRVATVTRCGRGEVQKTWNVNGLYRRLASIQRTTDQDNIANGQQIMRCVLSTAGPPPQRIAAKAHKVCAQAYSSTTHV